MISRERRDRIKSTLIRYPALFRAVRKLYIVSAAVQREVFTAIRFAPRLAASALRTRDGAAWQQELPVQAPSRVNAAHVTPTLNPEQIKAWCAGRRLPFSEGGDSLYLPPATWRGIPLASVLASYPADVGLKIAKQPGDSNAFYMGARSGRAMAQKVSFPHRLQTLIFNHLHAQDVSPRLYDLIEITDGSGVVWTAYAIAHVEPAPLRPGDCEHMVARLQQLERDGSIKLVSGAGWGGIDFEPPDCNRNLLRDAASERALYVDVHNFILENYDAHLRALADSVTELSHSGGRNLLLGGKSGSLLYQDFPGLERPAKRSTRARMQAWDSLLQRANVSFEGKVVFDIGCNLGLIGAEYLRRGTHWVHGWDHPEVVEAARKVMLAIGCTRFSLTGKTLSPQSDLAADLPDHLQGGGNDDAILSYLAARGHVGWLPGLATLPWRYMLYEGHQEDGSLDAYVAELNARIPVRLITTDRVSDGASGPRDIALIERLPR